ncbi:MAG: hypothetical protein JWN86_2759 [Planctomycetota bacterium]|nr:hypothetical protein [Planctomycetota bacterium]
MSSGYCSRANAPTRQWLIAAWIFLVLGTTGSVLAQNPPGPQEAELRRQLQIEREARKSLTYQADMRKAALLAEAEDWSGLRAVLDEYKPAEGDTDLRAWEWHFLDSLVKKTQLVDRQVAVLQGPSAGIHQLAWSDNGERLAAVGMDGAVLLWDVKTGKEVRRLGGGARYVAWDRDGQRLTVSAEKGTVSLWPADPGPSRRFFGPVAGLYDFRQPAFSPDGRMVALAVDKTSAAIHDAETGLEVRNLTGHQGLISVVAWHPEGTKIATGSSDGTIKIWDPSNGKETTSLDAGGDVFGLRWTPDGRGIAAVIWPRHGTRQVGIWDVARRERVFTAESHGGSHRPNQRQVALRISGDGKRIAAETMDGIAVWETDTSRPIFQATTGPRFSQLDGCDPEVRRWASLETVGTRATCRVIDMATMNELMRVDVSIPMNRYQCALSWSGDGKRLAAGFSQGKVSIYDVPRDRGEARVFNTGTATLFGWSPNGRGFAYSTQGEVRLGTLPARTATPMRLGPPLLLPSVVSLSPDGKFLAGADRDGSLPIWDTATGKIAQQLPGHPAPISDRLGASGRAAHSLVWSPDGRRLASLRGNDGDVRIWDLKSGKVLTSFQFGGKEISVSPNDSPPLAWSRDGHFLAARSGWPRKKIRILDVTTGRQTREWDGGPDTASSNAMAWDPTGKRLATCLGDPPRIQIREISAGNRVSELTDRVPFLREMSWSPDGLRLAYFSDRRWTIHDLTTGQSRLVEGAGERLCWKPDSSQIALFGVGPTSTGVISFADPATGTALPGEKGFASPDPSAMQLPAGASSRFNMRIQSVVWNEQGIQAAGDAMPYPGMGMLVVWDVRTGKPFMKLGQIYDAIADRSRVARIVAWAPDNRAIATLAEGSNENSRIDIWDAATGRKTRSLVGGRINSRGAAALAWSPDGQSLAFAGEVVQVWKVAIPLPPVTLRQATKGTSEPDQTFLAWSADSRGLAVLDCLHSSARDAVLTGWDLSTGKERFSWTRPYESSDLHTPIAWSPNGERLVWGGPKPAVWNVATSKEEFGLGGHTGPVVDVVWSGDGRRVMSRSEVFGGFTRSFELKVWEPETRREVLMLRGPMAGWLVAPGFLGLASPPGRGSDPGDVVVWDLMPAP